MQVLTVTYSEEGSNPPTPTTYTVTYDCNGGTSGCPANVTNITAGTQIQLADAPSRDNYEFDGWSDGTTTYGENVDYTVNGNVTFTAQWVENTTPGGDGTTATLNIQSYATANNWTNSTQYLTAIVNPVTFTANGGSNTGKYYTNGQDWRYYQNESASITISVPDGYTLVSVTPTYNVQNNGVLMNGNSTITSGSTVSVSGTSVTFTVGNSGTATNGQVRFTNIDVVYVSDGGTQTTSDLTITNQTTDLTFDLYNNSNAQVITYTTSSTGAITITPAESDYFTYVHDAQNKTITVTPTAVTPSAQTVTISQAADEDYYAGTATFTVSITDSAPLANIAALTAQTVASTYNVALSDAVVTYVNGNNAYIQDASGAVAMYKSGHGLTAGDVLNGTATVAYQLRNGNPQITDLTGVTPVSGTAPNPTSVAQSDWNYTFNNVLSQYFQITGATITQSNNKYYVSLGGENIQLYKSGTALSDLDLTKTYTITGFPTLYNSTKELQVYEAPQVEASAEPSVTVTPATINAPFAGEEGTLNLTYENIPDLISFDYYFCDANGGELEGNEPDWIDAEINEEEGVYTISYTIDPNEGEARTAYIKVFTPEAEGVYAIVTINQAQYVVDYATLPFEWESFDEVPTGITNNGVTINNYLKFDTSGDNIVLKFNERPGTLEFEVKGNPGNNGWAGTFKVQTSVDGVSYTDLQTYTELPTTEYQPESFATLDENVRYIKWVYTEKVSGNVAVNYISLAKYAHAIVIDPDLFEIGAEGGENGFEYTVNWSEGGMAEGFEFYDAPDGETIDQPEWITIVEQTGEYEDYHFTVFANEGEARSAYFKAYTDDEGTPLYSNLVTINQAAAPQQYTLTVEPFENLEIITFVNDEMVMEADGEIQVNDGDHIMLSIVADEGYVMETLMVNGVNHVNDIAADFTYEFDMPAEAVTISATAVEPVTPAGGDYVRITSLNQLTDGSKVIIAARYDTEHTNGYYVMTNATSNKPVGVLYTSTASGDDETLTVNDEDEHYWTVNETENGYTFTNAEGQLIGYTSGTNFATNGNNTEWTIESETAENTAMVPGYTGFVITNVNNDTRAFAFNGTTNHQFGAYSTSNMTAGGYNFFLDFFVQSMPSNTIVIDGYGTSTNGGYYLIASPVTVAPEDVPGMTEGEFDLYYFDESQDDEWRNWKANEGGHFDLEPGMGYLYAHKTGVTLTFEGEAYEGNGEVTLHRTSTNTGSYQGWNLVGNPYTEKAYIDRDYYVMNDSGTDFELADREDNYVNPMEGIFVIADENNETETMTFNTSNETPAPDAGKIVLNLRKNRSMMADRAMIRFGEGRQLPKLMFNPDNTKLYIAKDSEEFAVVRSIDENSTPVSFRPAENGTYTLSVNAEDIEMEYLHLIDNMTGADVDLLATPSYTFEARTTDYTSRFNLVYATCDDVNENTTKPFAFFDGSEWVINNSGNATLQVVDVTGRVLSSETLNGYARISIDQVPGVYMMRLVNGNDVKVQKVIIK